MDLLQSTLNHLPSEVVKKIYFYGLPQPQHAKCITKIFEEYDDNWCGFYHWYFHEEVLIDKIIDMDGEGELKSITIDTNEYLNDVIINKCEACPTQYIDFNFDCFDMSLQDIENLNDPNEKTEVNVV